MARGPEAARPRTDRDQNRVRVQDTGPDLPQMLRELWRQDPAFGHGIHLRSLGPGSVVATPEELRSHMYVLMEGKVHLVCTNREGRRFVVTTLEPGAVFGEGALDMPGDPTVFAEAATEVTLWAIPETEAQNMAIQYPILGWGMLQTYGRRLLQIEDNLEDVAYRKLPERLAGLLVRLAQEHGAVIHGVSHQSLADRLGTYRETVSAILRDFKRKGLVDLGYRRIQIRDLDRLKEIAGIWDG